MFANQTWWKSVWTLLSNVSNRIATICGFKVEFPFTCLLYYDSFLKLSFVGKDIGPHPEIPGQSPIGCSLSDSRWNHVQNKTKKQFRLPTRQFCRAHQEKGQASLDTSTTGSGGWKATDTATSTACVQGRSFLHIRKRWCRVGRIGLIWSHGGDLLQSRCRDGGRWLEDWKDDSIKMVVPKKPAKRSKSTKSNASNRIHQFWNSVEQSPSRPQDPCLP